MAETNLRGPLYPQITLFQRQKTIVGFFRCQICVQQASKPLGTNFRPFPYFWKNFRSFFFKLIPTPLSLHLKNFFTKKLCVVTKNLFCPIFSCLSAIQTKQDQKSKSGKPKNEEVCQGVGPTTSPLQKKPFGNRLRISRSKIDYLK